METLLTGVRVLDLCGLGTAICGKILGDMGADVIKVEKPGGDTARNVGPFYRGIPKREKSLFWFAFNNNKRGITLDIDTVEGQQIFKKLVEKADIVVESFHPGYMEGLGLGYEALKTINPKIIMTSITPFGQTGPYKDYKATDIVAWAMGGIMSVTGDPERPPVEVSLPQAYIAGGTYAAEGTMVAYYERQNSGLGQHVDVSIQCALTWINSELVPWWTHMGLNPTRSGGTPARRGTLQLPILWKCKDGYVNYLVLGGMPGAERNKAMAKWLEKEEFATEYYRTRDWDNFDWRQLTEEEAEQIVVPLRNLFLAHTMKELFAEAIKRIITLFPVTTIKDIVESPQLEARNFWTSVYHEELNSAVDYPGVPTIMSQTPLTIRCKAPLIGEHNREIYVDELGFALEELISLHGMGAI